MHLVSVITPAYNAEKTIRRCIDSVLNQSFEDFELLIINDGSSDSTEEICRSYNDFRLHIYSKENGGVSSAKNLGIEKSEGKYLLFVDADDALPKNAIETLISEADDETDLVIGAPEEIKGKKRTPFIRNDKTYTAEEFLDDYISHDSLMWGNVTILFRADIIKENGLRFNESVKYGEDHIFNLGYNQYLKGKVKVLSAIVYTIFQTAGSASTKYYPDKAEMDLELLRAFRRLLGDSFRGQERLVSGLFRGTINHYIAYLPEKEAALQTEKALALYKENADAELIKAPFSEKQAELLFSGKTADFLKDYKKSNFSEIARLKLSVIYKKALKFAK